MKQIVIGVLIIIVSLYLAGAFFNVSFDISNWSSSSRYAVSLISLSCIFMGLVIYGFSR